MSYQLPNVELFSLNTKNTLKREALHDTLRGKNVIIFCIPGAFTPTCSNSQVPDFDESYDDIKALGIDEVYCLSINDPFVMKAWWKQLKVQNVKYLCDGNAAFTARHNEVSGIAEPEGFLAKKYNKGLGVRSWRYAIHVENLIVTHVFMEESANPSTHHNSEDDPYLESTPESVISYLKKIREIESSGSVKSSTVDLSAPKPIDDGSAQWSNNQITNAPIG